MQGVQKLMVISVSFEGGGNHIYFIFGFLTPLKSANSTVAFNFNVGEGAK